MEAVCSDCGDYYDSKRAALGYRWCLRCGETRAKAHRFTVVPLHKSNYVVVTDPALLKGINVKGGNVK